MHPRATTDRKMISLLLGALDPHSLSFEDFDEKTYLRALLAACGPSFNTPHIILRFEDPADTNRLRVTASYGLPSEEAINGCTDAVKDKGLAEHLGATRRHYYVESIKDDPYYVQKQFAIVLGLGCALACPILVDDKLAGMIMFFKKQGDAFTKKQIEVISESLTVVIGNIHILAENMARSRRRFLEVTHDYTIESSLTRINIHEAQSSLDWIGTYVADLQDIMAAVKFNDENDKGRVEWLLDAIRDRERQIRGLIVDALRRERRFSFVKSITATLASCVHEIRFALGDTRVSYDVPSDRPISLIADEKELRQVFSSVLRNAQQAIEEEAALRESGYAGEIAIAVRDDAERVYIDVSDNGIGMNEELSDKVLDAKQSFWRKKSGSGVGLGLCQSIVKLYHHGDFRLSSRPHMGTTVHVVLRKLPSAKYAHLMSSKEEGHGKAAAHM